MRGSIGVLMMPIEDSYAAEGEGYEGRIERSPCWRSGMPMPLKSSTVRLLMLKNNEFIVKSRLIASSWAVPV